MKTKLLGVVGACLLAFSIGTANADTFYVNGTFSNSLVNTLLCQFGCNPFLIHTPDAGASLSGTVIITNGVLASVNLTANGNIPSYVSTLTNPVFGFVWTGGLGATLSNLSADGQSWDLSLVTHSGFGGGSLSFHDTSGVLTGAVAAYCCGLIGDPVGSLQQWNQDGVPGLEAWVDNYYGLTGTVVVTPLPAALPLFATGLGALGLLGWRRKRKT